MLITGTFPKSFKRGVSESDNDIGLARLHSRYDAAVLEADANIGRLIDGLRDEGVLEKTSIIITSDHRELLGEHDIYFDHHGLYERSIRDNDRPLVFLSIYSKYCYYDLYFPDNIINREEVEVDFFL